MEFACLLTACLAVAFLAGAFFLAGGGGVVSLALGAGAVIWLSGCGVTTGAAEAVFEAVAAPVAAAEPAPETRAAPSVAFSGGGGGLASLDEV